MRPAHRGPPEARLLPRDTEVQRAHSAAETEVPGSWPSPAAPLPAPAALHHSLDSAGDARLPPAAQGNRADPPAALHHPHNSDDHARLPPADHTRCAPPPAALIFALAGVAAPAVAPSGEPQAPPVAVAGGRPQAYPAAAAKGPAAAERGPHP